MEEECAQLGAKGKEEKIKGEKNVLSKFAKWRSVIISMYCTYI